jgi:O-6-methylguanine DNA methyltransferase
MSTIKVNDVEFEVEAARAGLSRLRLPPMCEQVRGIAGCPRPEAAVDCSGLDEGTSACLEATAVFLAELLQGRMPAAAPPVDLSAVSPFTREILVVVGGIPWGEVRSYAEIAAASGNQGAFRAAGGAVGRNPVPLAVPCHRVLRSDGTMGGWSGAPGWKEWLLDLEGSQLAAEAEVALR